MRLWPQGFAQKGPQSGEHAACILVARPGGAGAGRAGASAWRAAEHGLPRAGRATVWYTDAVALPLGAADLRERLLNGYYRQPGALVHDAETIAANAAAFNGPNSAVAARARGAAPSAPG